jgi:hypothetical protein
MNQSLQIKMLSMSPKGHKNKAKMRYSVKSAQLVILLRRQECTTAASVTVASQYMTTIVPGLVAVLPRETTSTSTFTAGSPKY